MIKHKTHTTKVLDGTMSLGASAILPNTLTVNGGEVPENLTVDYLRGTVTRSDAPDGTLYEFAFDYETPAAAKISVDATTITAGQSASIAVSVEDTTQSEAAVSVFYGDRLIGSYAVALTNGFGTWQPAISVAGAYRFELANIPAGTYNRPLYMVPYSVTVEAVNA